MSSEITGEFHENIREFLLSMVSVLERWCTEASELQPSDFWELLDMREQFDEMSFALSSPYSHFLLHFSRSMNAWSFSQPFECGG